MLNYTSQPSSGAAQLHATSQVTLLIFACSLHQRRLDRPARSGPAAECQVNLALPPVAGHRWGSVNLTAVLDLGQNPQPVLGSFPGAVLAGPQGQHVTLAVHGDAQGEVDRPVGHLALADLHVDRVD